MRPLLEARSLHKTYDAGGTPVHALRGVDATVGAGELVAIMGPSGCGKSTLLHLLGALDTPTSGDVLLDAEPLSGLGERGLDLVRRHRFGFIFQFFNLVTVLTAAENIALPMVIDGRPPAERASRVEEVMELVGVTDIRDKLPSELSGGQQQRIAIARALVMNPAVLLADEPTGNLDYRSGVQLMELVAGFNRAGQTVVIVTHDPKIAAYAQRVVLLRDGRVADELAMGAKTGVSALVKRLVALGEDVETSEVAG